MDRSIMLLFYMGARKYPVDNFINVRSFTFGPVKISRTVPFTVGVAVRRHIGRNSGISAYLIPYQFMFTQYILVI